VDARLKKSLPVILLVAGLAVVCWILAGCAALDAATTGPDGVTAAGSPVEEAVKIVTGFNPGIGGILWLVFAGYQFVRKRSRDGWRGFVMALVPRPGDGGLRGGGAL
jgi:hypothetical protein